MKKALPNPSITNELRVTLYFCHLIFKTADKTNNTAEHTKNVPRPRTILKVD